MRSTLTKHFPAHPRGFLKSLFSSHLIFVLWTENNAHCCSAFLSFKPFEAPAVAIFVVYSYHGYICHVHVTAVIQQTDSCWPLHFWLVQRWKSKQNINFIQKWKFKLFFKNSLLTLITPCFCSEQEVEVHQPGSAGGPECIAHPQHPIRPHVAGRPLLCDFSRRHGGDPEGPNVSAPHPAAEEM